MTFPRKQASLEAIRCFIRETEAHLEQCYDPVTRGYLEHQIAHAYKDFEKGHALSIISKAASLNGRLSIIEETDELKEDDIVPNSNFHLEPSTFTAPRVDIHENNSDEQTIIGENDNSNIMIIKEGDEYNNKNVAKAQPIYNTCRFITVLIVLVAMGIGIGLFFGIAKPLNFKAESTNEGGRTVGGSSVPSAFNTHIMITSTISGSPAVFTILASTHICARNE
jgi:hypothetical protein